MEKSFSEHSRNEKSIELLRWLAVLPAAVVGSAATRLILGSATQLVISSIKFYSSSAVPIQWIRLLILYPPKQAVFVVIGAKMAPRFQLATAVGLAVTAIMLSLTVHILVQPNPGAANYTHFAAESAGAILGAVFMAFSSIKTRSAPATTASNANA